MPDPYPPDGKGGRFGWCNDWHHTECPRINVSGRVCGCPCHQDQTEKSG